jgi:stage II sporulation protein D
MKKIAVISLVLTFLIFVLPLMAVRGKPAEYQRDNREEKRPENAIEAAGPTQIENNGTDPPSVPLSDDEVMVRVSLNGKTKSMSLRSYLLGVVAAEMPASYPSEALKAQAVAARTYTFSRIMAAKAGKEAHDGADVCTNPAHCKAYVEWEDRQAEWEKIGRRDYCDKIVEAVDGTVGEVILYNSEPIVAVFHAASGKYTENAKDIWGSDVPYLKSVESPEGADYNKKITYTTEEFRNRVNDKYPEAVLSMEPANWFGEVKYTEAGGVSSIVVGGVDISGKNMRALFDLPSSNFEIEVKRDKIIFNTSGYGHGVGMSQYGARALALKGKDYRDILLWYYTDVKIGKVTNKTIN